MIASPATRSHRQKGPLDLPERAAVEPDLWIGLAVGSEPQALGETTALGRGAHFELGHHLGTLRFDRSLGDAEGGGDLLVESAGDDEAEDLALAWTQRGEARAQRPRLLARLASGRLPRQRSLDGIEQGG